MYFRAGNLETENKTGWQWAFKIKTEVGSEMIFWKHKNLSDRRRDIESYSCHVIWAGNLETENQLKPVGNGPLR